MPRDVQYRPIVVPQILVPRYRDVASGVGIELRGEMTWQLIETKRFKRPTVVQSGRQSNLIVNAGLDAWLSSWGTGGSADLAPNIKYMAVGTGVTAPEVTQTSLTTELARVQYTTASALPGPPPALERQYTFNETQANGDLTEWGVFRNASGAPMWCRELFRDELNNPVVVTKTSTQVLLMKYTLYMQRSVESTSVQFTIGGTTYTCVTTINDAQLAVLRDYPIGYAWSSVKIRTGDANTASNVATDAQNKIYGTLLMDATPAQLPVIVSYVTGSRQRDITYYIGPTESNGNVGEFLAPMYYGTTQLTQFGCRVTFSPVIAKDSTKKIVLTVRFSFANV